MAVSVSLHLLEGWIRCDSNDQRPWGDQQMAGIVANNAKHQPGAQCRSQPKSDNLADSKGMPLSLQRPYKLAAIQKPFH